MQSKNILNKRKMWGEKPYYSLDFYLKQTFGEKIYKVALDGNMTCPNRDGTIDTRGCIFCSNGGSGEFAISCHTSITKQIDEAISFIKQSGKKTGDNFIAYFQSFSNTYAPVDKLEQIFTEAINHPKIMALSIGTRPDCFNEEIYNLIDRLNKIKPVWIELGLQTMHEKTAEFIRRGYKLDVFEKCNRKLQELHINVVVHVILGLPGETRDDMLATIKYLNAQHINGIKLQLLHILKGTDLALLYKEYNILSLEEYTDIIADCIANLSPEIVVHRITGDGKKDLLIAPKWSLNKRNVLNQIAHKLKKTNIYQGKYYDKGNS